MKSGNLKFVPFRRADFGGKEAKASTIPSRQRLFLVEKRLSSSITQTSGLGRAEWPRVGV